MTILLIGGLAALSLLGQVPEQGPIALKPGKPYAKLFAVPAISFGPADPTPGDVGRSNEQNSRPDVQATPAVAPFLPERGGCNMPMIRGDASVDPGFVRPVPTGSVDAKIRVVEPAVCWTKR